MKVKCRVLVAIGLLTMWMTGCAGKVTVTKVPENVPEDKKLQVDGVLYALPRTVVKVAVPVDRVESTKGIYADYARLFFPDASKGKEFVEVADDKKTRFSIGKATFSTFGEPDPSKLYYVKLTGWGPVDRTASLDYTEQGTLSGIQGGVDNYTTDIILSGISAVSGIATRVVKFGAAETISGKTAPVTCPKSSSPDEDKKVYEFFKGEKAEEVFFNYCHLEDNSKKVIASDTGKGKNSSLDKALEGYKEIRDLTQTRLNLITQKGLSVPFPSLELMLKEIDALLAKKMAALFTGQKTKDTWTPIFELRPTSVTDKPVELLKLDETSGVCLKEPLHAQDDPPAGFISKNTGLCTSTKAKTVRIRFALDGKDQQVFQRILTAFKQDGERSFRYLIPAATLATLEIEDLTKEGQAVVTTAQGGKAVIMVGQFGAEVSLPASSGGRSLNYALKFFEATGALKSFSLTSKTAMQGAVVNSISSSTNAILDTKNKQTQDAANKADELTRLERQRKILEERAKIQELCAQPEMNCQQ